MKCFSKSLLVRMFDKTYKKIGVAQIYLAIPTRKSLVYHYVPETPLWNYFEMFTIFSSVTARTEKTVSDIGSKSGEVRLLPLLTITHLNNVWGFASYNAAIATKTQKENKLYWAPSDNWNFHSIFLRGTFRHTHRLYLQVHSMLPCACSVIGPGWRQNVVETEMLDEMRCSQVC